mgnify:CR=1 FL=1
MKFTFLEDSCALFNQTYRVQLVDLSRLEVRTQGYRTQKSPALGRAIRTSTHIPRYSIEHRELHTYCAVVTAAASLGLSTAYRIPVTAVPAAIASR